MMQDTVVNMKWSFYQVGYGINTLSMLFNDVFLNKLLYELFNCEMFVRAVPRFVTYSTYSYMASQFHSKFSMTSQKCSLVWATSCTKRFWKAASTHAFKVVAFSKSIA